MRVALIPPLAYLQDTKLTDIQLVLPHMLANEKYYATYMEHFKNPNQYTILDNGAAEGIQIEWDDLLRLAIHLQPNEMALPDILADKDATVLQAIEFISAYGNILEELIPAVKIGYVAQGNNIKEAYQGLLEVLQHPKTKNFVDVIYLPRLLIKATNNPYARIELLTGLINAFGNQFEYHLFGASPYWPGEVQVASTMQYCRSIDTSLPYQFAFKNGTIKPLIISEDELVSREEDYFENIAWSKQTLLKMISGINVKSYLGWINPE